MRGSDAQCAASTRLWVGIRGSDSLVLVCDLEFVVSASKCDGKAGDCAEDEDRTGKVKGVLRRRCDLGSVGGKWELERAEMPASIL